LSGTPTPPPITPYPNPPRYEMMGESNSSYVNDDLLLNDVVSFDVRILLAGDNTFRDLADPQVQLYSGNNPAFPAGGPYAFDTWSSQKDSITGDDYSTWSTPGTNASVPLYQKKNADGTTTNITIKAVQITIRAWDFKTKKARQVTLIQQM